jgi:hypothetical protein
MVGTIFLLEHDREPSFNHTTFPQTAFWHRPFITKPLQILPTLHSIEVKELPHYTPKSQPSTTGGTPQCRPTWGRSSTQPPTASPPSSKISSPLKTTAIPKTTPTSAACCGATTPRKGDHSQPGFLPTQERLLPSSSSQYTPNPASALAMEVYKTSHQQAVEP